MSLLAGLVAVVYLLGGLVLAARLHFAGLSLDSIAGVIGLAPREAVVSTGLLLAVGPALLVGLLAGLALVARNKPFFAGPDPKITAAARWEAWMVGLVIASAAPAVTIALTGLIDVTMTVGAWLVVGTLVTVGLAILAWYGLRRVGMLGGFRLTRAIGGGLLVSLAVLTPVALVGSAFTFESAIVCLKDGSSIPRGNTHEALLISESKDRVTLLVSEPTSATQERRSIVTVPGGEVRETRTVEPGWLGACPEKGPATP